MVQLKSFFNGIYYVFILIGIILFFFYFQAFKPIVIRLATRAIYDIKEYANETLCYIPISLSIGMLCIFIYGIRKEKKNN